MQRSVIILLLLAGFVGGCGAAAEPEPLPPAAAPSATAEAPEPSASPVPVPSAATAETPEGAAAFARFFYAEVERAYAARDPEIICRLSAPGCETCQLFVESLTRLRDHDERVSGFGLEIVAAEAPAFSGQAARVDVIFNSPLMQRLDSTGAVIYEESATQGAELQLSLIRAADGWLMREVDAV